MLLLTLLQDLHTSCVQSVHVYWHAICVPLSLLGVALVRTLEKGYQGYSIYDVWHDS